MTAARQGSLAGKVAFITGAARGQGRAHAVKLAAEGADIIAVDLCDQIASVPYPLATPEDLAATVKLVQDTGARIVARQADVRDRAALKTALAEGIAELGRLDIVIANAGIAPMMGEDAWQDVIDVNLTGVYHTVDVAMRPLIKQGEGGSVVLTSSVAGLVGIGAPIAGSLGYTVAKHGVVGLMRAYANFLAQLQHPGQLGAPGRGGHPDDRQRVHPLLARGHRPAAAGRTGHDQCASGADTGGRAISPTRCCGWCPTPRGM